MCVLTNDPFYQIPATIFGLTYREVWEWVVRKPYENARKESGRPSYDEATDPDVMANNVAKLFGVDPEIIANAIKETEGNK